MEGMKAMAYLDVQPPIDTVAKSSVALDDTEDVRKGIEHANVLFLLDVGSTMTFTATGTMPEMRVTARGQAEAAQMLKQATYGHGGLPLKGSNNSLPKSRYGREGLDPADEKNNMTPGNTNLAAHINNYYSPFDYKDNPASAAFGGPYGLGSAAAPYALVFRNPAHWINPPARFTNADLVPNDSRMYKMKLVMWRVLSDTVLMENLRFGMATTFQELNGPSTDYGADFFKTGPLDDYRTHGWIPSNSSANNVAFNPPGFGAFKNISGLVNFPYGTGPGWATNLRDMPFTEPGRGYYQSAAAHFGIDRAYYDEAHNTVQWKLMNRAYLRVPIAEYSIAHVKKFHMWIDGYENVTVKNNTPVENDPYFFENPELIGDGKTFLSTAIYPGHPEIGRNEIIRTKDTVLDSSLGRYAGTQGVVFSSKNGYTVASINKENDYRTYRHNNPGNFIGNFFKKGSGEALGTILDFFSPPVHTVSGSGVISSAQNVSTAPEESFPLKDPCEKNWVIVFTAGDDNADDKYSSADAVEDLYNNTKKGNTLTKLKEVDNSGNNIFEGIQLEDGVRTLVVGFVDPEANASKKLRDRLNEMARKGDPGNDEARAFFANDVEGLVHAMRSVLARINSEIQPAKGSMLEGDTLQGEYMAGYDPNDPSQALANLYAASYRINFYDQWQGTLTKYITMKTVNSKGVVEIETLKDWEMGSKLLSSRNMGLERNLYFWAGAGSDGKNYVPLEYTPLNASDCTKPHPTLSRRNINLVPPVESMDVSVLSPANPRWSDRMHPSRALVNWLHGYEITYGSFSGVDAQYDRRHMLSDQGNSGISKVGPPSLQKSLPGYGAFAENKAGLPLKLYFQSNDGLLHVVDAKTGNEDMAILPPPSLMPYRLFGLKTTKTPETGRYRWINVDSFLTTASDDIPITSIPSFTLDGPAQLRYFDMDGKGEANGSGWRAYYIATIGRAGGGVYAMDATNPAIPAFRWYRETYEDENGKLHLYLLNQNSPNPDPVEIVRDSSAALWADMTASAGSADMYPFYQLGFNSPKPHFAAAKHERTHEYPDGFYNIIALGGGVQNYLDPRRNGAMGAAFYLIDPDLKYHLSSTSLPSPGLRVFNSGSLAAAPSAWRDSSSVPGAEVPNPYMGMIVTEPVFLASPPSEQYSNYVARGVFTADNRGSIFYVSFVDHKTKLPLPRKDWDIRTIATLRRNSDAPDAGYSLPLGVVAGSRYDKSDKWVAGGTSNVGTKGDTDENDAMIRNNEQLIFSFKMPEMADHTADNYGMTKRSDWTRVYADLDKDGGGSGIDEGRYGWYLKLLEKDASYFEEYVTAQPVMFNGILFAATFREEDLSVSNGLCDTGKVLGKSRLYALMMDTGKAGVWDGKKDKYIEFEGLKITGFTLSEMGGAPSLLVTYEILDIAAANASLNDADAQEMSITRSEGDLDFMTITLETSSVTLNVSSNDQIVNYWRFIE
jgi:hypothetical protein